MKFEVLSPGKSSYWNQKLSTSHFSSSPTVFHSAEWGKVLFSTYKFKPCYFYILKEKYFQIAIPMFLIDLPFKKNKLVSLPFSDFCTPLSASEDYFNDLFQEIISYSSKHNIKYVEFTSDDNFFDQDNANYFFYSHTLFLNKDEKELFNSLSSNTQRNIRKAINNDILVKRENDLGGLKKYYKMHCKTRKRLGLPPQPFSFFNSIYKNLIVNNLGDIFIAYLNDIYISGAIFLHSFGLVTYKFGASLYEFQNYRANNLLMWEAIKYYNKNGFISLNFGRTDEEHEGLRRFKLGFGTNETKVFSYKFDSRSGSFVKSNKTVSSKLNSFFRLLPIILLRLIGKIAYKYVA